MSLHLHRRARRELTEHRLLHPLRISAGLGARVGVLAVVTMVVGLAWMWASALVPVE